MEPTLNESSCYDQSVVADCDDKLDIGDPVEERNSKNKWVQKVEKEFCRCDSDSSDFYLPMQFAPTGVENQVSSFRYCLSEDEWPDNYCESETISPAATLAASEVASNVSYWATEFDNSVILHVYHCDAATAYLNDYFLSPAQIPIHHVGVEVYGLEWTFQYFKNTWLNSCSVSGVQPSIPKQAAHYVKSINIGRTPLSQDDVSQLIAELKLAWRASSYHLTERNCLHFAETFADRLKTPSSFPAGLKAVLGVAQETTAGAIVSYAWTWSKWWMLKTEDQVDRYGPVKRERSNKGGFGGCVNLVNLTTSSCTPVLPKN